MTTFVDIGPIRMQMFIYTCGHVRAMQRAAARGKTVSNTCREGLFGLPTPARSPESVQRREKLIGGIEMPKYSAIIASKTPCRGKAFAWSSKSPTYLVKNCVPLLESLLQIHVVGASLAIASEDRAFRIPKH